MSEQRETSEALFDDPAESVEHAIGLALESEQALPLAVITDEELYAYCNSPEEAAPEGAYFRTLSKEQRQVASVTARPSGPHAAEPLHPSLPVAGAAPRRRPARPHPSDPITFTPPTEMFGDVPVMYGTPGGVGSPLYYPLRDLLGLDDLLGRG